MGSNSLPKKQFVGNSTLNDLLNETAQGDTNLDSPSAPITDPFGSSEVISTEAMPESVANVVNKDYRALMKAIDKKKNK